MGTFEAKCKLGSVSSPVIFHVFEITTSYNLLLGRAWMKPKGIVPYTIHQKLKLPWKGGIITILGDREINAQVCDIRGSNEDLRHSYYLYNEEDGLQARHGVRQVQPRN
jgi:hypothetical protein